MAIAEPRSKCEYIGNVCVCAVCVCVLCLLLMNVITQSDEERTESLRSCWPLCVLALSLVDWLKIELTCGPATGNYNI